MNEMENGRPPLTTHDLNQGFTNASSKYQIHCLNTRRSDKGPPNHPVRSGEAK